MRTAGQTHGNFAPHVSDSCHFQGELVLLSGKLGEPKSEEGLSGLIRRGGTHGPVATILTLCFLPAAQCSISPTRWLLG
jgi:hypothetical protein